MKDAATRSNSIIFTILVALVFLSLIVTAFAKDYPIDVEDLRRNKVIEKYKALATILSLD